MLPLGGIENAKHTPATLLCTLAMEASDVVKDWLRISQAQIQNVSLLIAVVGQLRRK